MDAAVRRMIIGVAIFIVIGIVFSVRRGDSVSTTSGYALAGVVGGGLVIACYLWARRKS